MADIYRLESKEVIRVKVKKYDGLMQPEYKRFCIDPQITSFEMLQNLLARAFNIKSDFTIGYLSKDVYGQAVYLSMLSDWDMDAAFQGAANPYLKLKVDLRPFEEGLDDWDIIAPLDIPRHRLTSLLADKGTLLSSITDTITSQMEKTMTQVQKAMGLGQPEQSPYKSSKPPMSDFEFRNYLDSDGCMVKPQEFRLSIYQGGVEPSLRRVVWRHLLNIFPMSLSGRQRFDYMKSKENEYYQLRDEWKKCFGSGACYASEELKYVASMVKKDVLRTDRTHKFYAGSDENKNVLSLFHILVTYAISHPQVSYCQGMSDIASPLLVIQKDEAQAYLCFCGIMQRLQSNFLPDGRCMTDKFQHLADLVKFHDPVFFAYLKECDAQDLFFCYRWLLLECKREFPFDDVLYMLEVMWSTLPPNPPPESGLELSDVSYSVSLLCNSPGSPPFMKKLSIYAKLLARHRENSVHRDSLSEKKSYLSLSSSTEQERYLAQNSVNNNSRISTADYSPSDENKVLDDTTEYKSVDDDDVMTRSLRAKSCCIDESLEKPDFTLRNGCLSPTSPLSPRIVDSKISDITVTACEAKDPNITSAVPDTSHVTDLLCESDKTHCVSCIESQQGKTKDKRSPKHRPPNLVIPTSEHCEINVISESEAQPTLSTDPETSDSIPSQPSMEFITESPIRLPSPEVFGLGNPFLMFISLSLLVQHRNYIMRNRMDYDELAMFFDKMVRKHDVHRMLQHARVLYTDYLRSDQTMVEEDDDEYEASL